MIINWPCWLIPGKFSKGAEGDIKQAVVYTDINTVEV